MLSQTQLAKFAVAKKKEMEDIKYPESCIKVLDKGFVRLVDVMGNDDSIVQAARVSYGKGTKQVSEDRGLIRYLMRHHHMTPFEMVEFKFQMRLPIFVARQLIRHRTANVNEYSLRYSDFQDMFHVPDEKDITKQSTSNRQGGSDELLENTNFWHIRMQQDQKNALKSYDDYMKADMRKELARGVLPVSAYTEWYWKCDLRNIFGFLFLRLDSHAQYEIRVFAQAMAEYVKKQCPVAYEAFEDYHQNAVTLSSLEVKAIQRLARNKEDVEGNKKFLDELFTNKRERLEFDEKVKKVLNE